MIYDDKLSNDVSLSRILDALIESGESPTILVQFLKKYDSHFKDIAYKSMYIDRIYCSDYLRKCKHSDAEYLLSHLEDIVDKPSAMYCAWQCLKLAAEKHEFSFLKKQSLEFVNRQENRGIRHPYAGYGYSDIKAIDTDFIINGFCPELAFDSFKLNELDNFISGCMHSLFAARLFQIDCFNACSDLHKFVIIKSLENLPKFIAFKFTKQLLVSNIAPDVKYEIIKQGVLPYIAIFSLAKNADMDDLFRLIDKANDYASIAIHMTLNGEDAIADGILYMLAIKKYKMLAEMAELDPDTMKNNFPINDLIEYIKNNTCLIEAQKHRDKQEQYAA